MSKQTAADLRFYYNAAKQGAEFDKWAEHLMATTYDLAVAALPEKSEGKIKNLMLMAKEQGHDEAIDQSIEALRHVFNQEGK